MFMFILMFMLMILFSRLTDQTQQILFTCRVIHSVPLMMSAVQVYYRDRMAAVSHLIGTDQLPIPSQVGVESTAFPLNRTGASL